MYNVQYVHAHTCKCTHTVIHHSLYTIISHLYNMQNPWESVSSLNSSTSEVNVRGSENVLTVSVTLDSKDATTQTSTTSPASSCVCLELMADVKKLMAMIEELQDEVRTHGGDIYEIRRQTDSISRRFESVVSMLPVANIQ